MTVVVALAVLAMAGPAWAHVDAPAVAEAPAPILAVFGPEALSAAAPASPGRWLLLAAGAAVAAALVLRDRRALALVLLALLTLGAFEAAVHSVHHLADHAEAAKCAVAAVSSQTGGVPVDTVAVERPADVVTFAAPPPVVTVAPVRRSAPDLGRAPPSA